MTKTLLAAFLLCFGSLHAQKKSSPEKYAASITVPDLKKQLYIIAAADMEGRETATPGQRKAAAYIESEFRRIGLQPGNQGSYLQHFSVYQDSLIAASLIVNRKHFALYKDFDVNLNSLQAKHAYSEVVYISKAVPVDSIKPGSLSGKLVVIAGERRALRYKPSYSQRLEALRKAGPAAIFYIATEFGRSATNRDMVLSEFKKSQLPQQFYISQNVVKEFTGKDYEKAVMAKHPITFRTEVLLTLEKFTKPLQSSNVIGILPGTDLKDEYLFITAHYDHLGKTDSVIYYGADDDGSGTACVIELAEAWAKAKAAGKGPRRSIVFMAVSGEEKGLLGSEYYTKNPVFPLNKTTANLNIDMVGRTDSRRIKGDSMNYVYVVGDDKISSELKPLNEAQNNKYVKLELDYKYNDPADLERIYYRSDHYNFAEQGVPIIFYTDGMEQPDYHRPTDTPDKINYTLLQKRAHLVFYTSWEMANRDGMLVRDIPLPL